MHEELTAIETCKLENLESVIETGLKSFLDVGRALLEIRDQRLYRMSHKTFEDYCLQRWDMTSRHASRLADAAETIDLCLDSIGPIGPKPANESQVRPLTQLPLEDRASAWQEAVAVSDGKPTAAVVEEVVASRIHEGNGHENGKHELSKGEQESREIRDVFKSRLAKVTDGAVYTLESLSMAIGSQDTKQCTEARWFIRQCEISPSVKVHRTYGRKGLVQYTFVLTKCVTAHARIRQLADQIATDSSVNGRSQTAAEQILSLLGG